MEPERQRHIGIPASTSNRVAAIGNVKNNDPGLIEPIVGTG
jgi:hypothetical protein